MLKSLWAYLSRFFLPWACAGCRTALGSLEDDGFCGRCWLQIPRIQGLVCQHCGIPLKDGGYSCYGCREQPPPLIIRAATEYSGVIRPAIHRFKYGGRKSLTRPFSALLRYAWDLYPEIHAVHGVVPVPLHLKNERRRGFNQAELLADALSQEIAVPLLPILVRCRSTRSQYELTRPARRQNVELAFALHSLVQERGLSRGLSFLLVDDVCTTTNTLSECARALLRAGARSVKALVLARDL